MSDRLYFTVTTKVQLSVKSSVNRCCDTVPVYTLKTLNCIDFHRLGSWIVGIVQSAGVPDFFIIKTWAYSEEFKQVQCSRNRYLVSSTNSSIISSCSMSLATCQNSVVSPSHHSYRRLNSPVYSVRTSATASLDSVVESLSSV